MSYIFNCTVENLKWIGDALCDKIGLYNIATDKGYITDEYAPCDVEYELEVVEESTNIHEVMYQLAIKNGSTLTMGGSEEIQ